MKKKIIIITIGIIIALALLILLKITLTPKPLQENYYTPEPEPWIEENILTEEEDFIISVKRATRDKSELNENTKIIMIK